MEFIFTIKIEVVNVIELYIMRELSISFHEKRELIGIKIAFSVGRE